MQGFYPLYVGAALYSSSQEVGAGKFWVYDTGNGEWCSIDVTDGVFVVRDGANNNITPGGGSLTVREVDGTPSGSCSTLVFPNGSLGIAGTTATITLAGSGDMVLASAQTVTGAKTFNDSTLLLRNVANTFSAQFTNTNTAARTYTLPDAAGTIALTSNITGTNSGTNTGDQTITLTGAVTGSGTGAFVSSLGSFTKSQLDTAVSDGNVMYVGDAPTSHVHAGTDITAGTVDPARLGSGTSITTKFLRGDSTWQAISGGGDALVASTLDQFADVTQTAGQTLAITASTTLSGGTHSGTNTGDQTNISGNASTVTTNANLTGHVTSTGNATVLGSFTKAQLDTAVSDGNVFYVGDSLGVGTYTLLKQSGTEPSVTPTGTTATIDLNSGNMQTINLGSASGNVTLTLTIPSGTCSAIGSILANQGATARNLTIVASDSSTIRYFDTKQDTSTDSASTTRGYHWRWNGLQLFIGQTAATTT